MIGKLLGLATIGSAVASVGLLHRFLSNIAGIIVLSIVSAIMLCVLLAGGFYLAYFCLVHYGLDPYAAGITVGTVLFFVTFMLIILTMTQLQRLRDLTHSGLYSQRTGLPDIGNIANAFIDGFLNHKK